MFSMTMAAGCVRRVSGLGGRSAHLLGCRRVRPGFPPRNESVHAPFPRARRIVEGRERAGERAGEGACAAEGGHGRCRGLRRAWRWWERERGSRRTQCGRHEPTVVRGYPRSGLGNTLRKRAGC